VKIFVLDYLFSYLGSGKPFHLNKYEYSTLKSVKPRYLFPDEIYQISDKRE